MPVNGQAERLFLVSKALEERRKTDPLQTWQPHEGQQRFINAVFGAKGDEVWAFCANRWGKTDVGAYCGSKLARFGPPDNEIKPSICSNGTVVYDRATSGWVIAADANTNRDIVQPKYFNNRFVPAGQTHPPFIPDREIEGGSLEKGWRVSDQILKLKCGSLIGFKSCEAGASKFPGVEKDWIHFDEEPDRRVYVECTFRVGGRRLRLFGTCTLLPPEGQIGGVSWMYPEIILPYQRGTLQGVEVLTGSIYENKHLPQDYIARLESKYPEGSVERRIRLDGELLPGLSGALAYTAFNRSLHVRSEVVFEPRRPLCWMLDFNVEPMVSLVGQRVGRLFRVHRELILDQGSVPDMGQFFRQEYPTHRAEIWIYGDATGKHRSVQTNKTNYQLLLNELKGYPVPLVLKVPEVNPGVADRINAVNRALRDEYGEIGFEIHEKCEELIADLEMVRRARDGKIHKTFNKSDPYFHRTHTSDAMGYWVAREQPVTGEPLTGKPEVQTSKQYDRRMTLPSYTTMKRP